MNQTEASNKKVRSEQCKTRRKIMGAIRRVQNPDSSSLPEIKKHLISRPNKGEVPSTDDMKSYITFATDREKLVKNGRKYILSELITNKDVAKRSIKQKENDAKLTKNKSLPKKIRFNAKTNKVTQEINQAIKNISAPKPKVFEKNSHPKKTRVNSKKSTVTTGQCQPMNDISVPEAQVIKDNLPNPSQSPTSSLNNLFKKMHLNSCNI